MFQFTRKDPKSGITYVYEQESHWVPELKQSRAVRRIIGKLDEEGNIVPTRSRRKKGDPAPNGQVSGDNQIVDDRIEKLEKRIAVLEKQNAEFQKLRESDMQAIRKIGNQLISI
ncbi:MAG: hypothetical protein IJ088_04185 [Clostridia bacterium]|nr:hypothetical protein [Clostridia bacterium]